MTTTSLEPWMIRALDAAAAVAAAGLLLLAAFGITGPVRGLLALAFVTFVPGWALLDHVRLAEGGARLALAVPLSLTACAAAATVALWLHWWHPLVMLDGLGGLSLVALVGHLSGPARPGEPMESARPAWPKGGGS